MPRSWKNYPEKLIDLAEGAYKGKVVVPDFQRSFKWGVKGVQELLVSVLQDYFIGTFLVLETRGDKSCPFAYELVEGVEEARGEKPEKSSDIKLVLDGQQRITSMFYALFTPRVNLKGTAYPQEFYVDTQKVLKGEIDADAVVCKLMAEDTSEIPTDSSFMPFRMLRDYTSCLDWIYEHFKGEERKTLQNVVKRFHDYEVSVIYLEGKKDEDIVEIFERVNRTGIRLSTFDLVTARLYKHGLRLRTMWKEFRRDRTALARNLESEDILRLISILRKKECKRKHLLELKAASFKEDWATAIKGLEYAFSRATEVYGVIDYRKFMPYRSMLIPLGASLFFVKQGLLGKDAYDKLDKWFWASIFSERYGATVDTMIYQDYNSLLQWFSSKDKTPKLFETSKTQISELEKVVYDLKSRGAAQYRGIACMIATKGALDFHTGEEAKLSTITIDHVFPKSKFGDQKYVHSILNKTLLSKETNEIIKRAKKPSVYVKELLSGHDNDEKRLLKTLSTHLIDRKCYDAMNNDRFDDFIESRKDAILKEIYRRTALS